MPAAYATPTHLADFLAAADAALVSEPDRLLKRASELMDETVRRPFAVDAQTDLPTDDAIAEAMRDATCAQVEFWLHLGEDHDTEAMAGRQVSVGHLSMAELPPELAPRAKRILHVAGLLSGRGFDRADVTFFATQAGT